jgi:hypothetical protein
MASRRALELTEPRTQWAWGALSPGIKRPGRKADHSPPSSAKIKNGGAITPLSQTNSESAGKNLPYQTQLKYYAMFPHLTELQTSLKSVYS